VIPKIHYSDLLELPEEEACHLIQTVKKIAPAVLAAVGATGFNLALNNSSVAGQVVGHVHFHLMPRLAGDGRELWHGGIYEAGQSKAVAEKIRAELNN